MPFLGARFVSQLLDILLILHSACVDAADLHIDLLSVPQIKLLKDLPIFVEHLPQNVTSFTGSVASRVQGPNSFAIGK